MRASRGMGAVRASKMPKGKTITRKDNPDKVRMFAAGGSPKKPTPREEPSRPLTADEMRRARPKPEGVKVPDRLFQGTPEEGDDMVRKPTKKAKGGALKIPAKNRVKAAKFGQRARGFKA
jgi:hypothetical protein